MKRFIMTVAVALCVIVPFLAEAQDSSAVTTKIKFLTAQKEQLRNELKELEKDWNRPRANMSEEELVSMKERYDSLSLDKKSAILGIDLEIAEISEISN